MRTCVCSHISQTIGDGFISDRHRWSRDRITALPRFGPCWKLHFAGQRFVLYSIFRQTKNNGGVRLPTNCSPKVQVITTAPQKAETDRQKELKDPKFKSRKILGSGDVEAKTAVQPLSYPCERTTDV